MKKAFLSKFVTGLCVNLFFFATILFFLPLEVFMGNVVEFAFPFANVWWIMLLLAVGCTLVLSLAESLLPRVVTAILHALTAAAGIACYVQSMFLNGKMVSLTGDDMQLTQGDITVNLIIWAVILLGVVAGAAVLFAVKKRKLLSSALRYVSILLVVMQLTGFVTTALTTDLSGGAGEILLMADGQFEFSPNKNVAVFVLDTCDGDILEETLRLYPEVNDILSGFVNYRNATSAYSRTFPALTWMLTDERFYYDEPVAQYVDRAFTKAPMLREMRDKGVDVRLYTSELMLIGNAAADIISNTTEYQYSQVENLSLQGLTEGMLTMSLYKALPYALKEEYEYDATDINEGAMNVEEYYYNDMDFDFYTDLLDASVTVNPDFQSAFRFYHLWGSHPGILWDDELNYVEDRTVPYEEGLRGSMMIIDEFVQQLKAQGIFDQTTIIITADHGYSGHADLLYAPKAACPVMLVKHAHADASKPLVESRAPVSHEDLFATYMEGLGLDGSAYGRSISAIKEDEERERFYYYTGRRV